ncbi:MAG: HAMP domain-containing sensor histidine kinase [Motiliproteus sp.]
MNSIEQRIRYSLILTLLVTFTALAVLANYGVKQLSRDFVLTRLQHDSDSLIRAMSLSQEAHWVIDTHYMPVIYQRVKSGHYFQVVSSDQRIRSRSLWDQTPAVAPQAVGQSVVQLDDVDQERWLIWQQSIELQDRQVTLWIAEDIAPLEQQWQRFTALLSATMLVALIILVALQRYLIRKSFAQLTDLEQAINQLKQGEIKAISASVPSEIKPLTNEINHLLERLEQRTSRSRTAMGNLAHELKRQLQQLHLLSSDLPDHVVQQYRSTLEQISRLIERELKRARIAGDSHPGRRFNPNDDLPYLLEVLAKIYPAMAIKADIAATAELPFDRDDMLELIGNLLDNACKYGASKVHLRLSLSDSALLLSVSNDGTEITASIQAQLLSRGVRTDESIEGSGLGLSICQMIIASYGGELSIGPDAGAGANDRSGVNSDDHYPVRFSVRLPLR